MIERRVTCVEKPDRANRHEHIKRIGNRSENWSMTREEAIRRIESKAEAFYTVDAMTGKKAYVAVVKELYKDPYLRTHADGKWNDNLLALAECGPYCQLIG